jgi:SAM-dependent methyltransferase
VTPTTCAACGGPLRPWRTVPALEPSDPRSFELLRCDRCGSAATAGDPPATYAYETGVYAESPPRAEPLLRLVRRAAVAQPVTMLRRAGLRPGARVLDAGAGTGFLVEALGRAGFDARGIDSSERSLAIASEAGRAVERGSIEDLAAEDLDAVVLWHVLEHLDDPAEGLRRVRAALRPGGLLLAGVPNLDSLSAELAGDEWLAFDVPRHRWHFTAGGLEQLLQREGLLPGRLHHLVWEQNPAVTWTAILGRLGMTPGYPFHLLKRNANGGLRDGALLAAGLPLAPVAVAVEAWAARHGRGASVAAVAQAA